MGVRKKWTKLDRDQVVLMRKGGVGWSKISKATGIPKSTCISIWKADAIVKEEIPSAPPGEMDGIEEAYVLKHVPNPRLMLIAFPAREGFARCVKRPEDNRPVKSKLLVRRVEDDLYKLV